MKTAKKIFGILLSLMMTFGIVFGYRVLAEEAAVDATSSSAAIMVSSTAIGQQIKSIVKNEIDKTISQAAGRLKEITVNGSKNGLPAIVGCNSDLVFGNKQCLDKDCLKIKMNVTETRLCKYTSGPESEGVFNHVFSLINKNKSWAVDAFENGENFKAEASEEDKKLPKVYSPEEALKKQIIKNDKSKASSAAVSLASATYNRNYAAWYGSYYAINPNSSFRSFSADCTNFVSQAVWYGNWPMLGSFPSNSDSVWWYSFGIPYTQSYTWVSAHHWWWFTYNRRAFLTNSFCNLQLGDVVQADWTKDGIVDHAMIVTYKNNCDIRVSYHSNNQKNKPIQELVNQNPNSWYWAWKLYDSI